MASFSLKHEKDSKCRSLNSPVFLKNYSRSQKLRGKLLDWDDWQKKSLEYNQSFTNALKVVSSEESKNLEAAEGNEYGYNMIEFESEENTVQQSAPLPLKTCEPNFPSDNLLNWNLTNSSVNESVLPSLNASRAIFTIHLPSFQILVVNSAACQLVNYSSDELCLMKLENIIAESDRHKLLNLYEKSLNSLSETNGKLLDLVKKDSESISVSMCLKKLENSEKCLVIVDPVDVRSGLISVEESGKIIYCNEEIAAIFEYDAAECVGVNIYTLLPAIDLSQINEEDSSGFTKQQITGRTKNGYIFPVSLAVSQGTPSSEFTVAIWVYPNLNGLILLNKRLIITNISSSFIKLLFGLSKKEIINQSIVSLIPTFCKDVEFEKTKKGQWQTSVTNDTSVSYWYGRNEADQDCGVNSVVEECLTALKNRCSLSFNNATDLPKQCEWSKSSTKIDYDGDIQTLFPYLDGGTIQDEQGSTNVKDSLHNGSFSEKHIETLDSGKRNDQKANLYESCFENHQSVVVQEGKFLGFAQHSDGSYIAIKYQVKTPATSEESFYCVWLSRDFFQFLDLHRGSNLNMLCSFNSASVDSSMPKDSTCSGQYTKPSTASLISQCDETLTAGDYSQYYTNIRQIGKGAFGYVKMAFRNSDGLLVVTKFIKKQSINIRSWVFHSNLNMKIPLEISLLTTLYHPNIVKVLDVFHNDSFVQLVMEKHGAGFDLFEFINRGPKCDEKLKSYIFRQVFTKSSGINGKIYIFPTYAPYIFRFKSLEIISAVHYLDSLGILHRDIKDENVIINEKFEVKLIDFGSATFMPPNETFSKFYGTVEYCSPEVLLGNSYKGPELEIWALGVTLYVLTFGENPFCNIEEIIKGQFSIPFPITKELDELLHQMLEKNVENRIPIDQVVQHPWINQPVSIESYRFKDVVRCSDEEAYPPKYVHEINTDDLFAKDSRTYSNQLGDTNNSNSSLQNLTEIDDLDDNFQVVQKSLTEFVGNKTNSSSVLLSSTPIPLKNERLCKSATAITNPLENSLSLSECSYECREDSYAESDLTNKYLKHFKDCSSSENESDGAKEEISDFSDVLESEIEMHLKKCNLLEEEYLRVSHLSEHEVLQNVKEVYEESEGGRFLGTEDDTDNDCFNPN